MPPEDALTNSNTIRDGTRAFHVGLNLDFLRPARRLCDGSERHGWITPHFGRRRRPGTPRAPLGLSPAQRLSRVRCAERRRDDADAGSRTGRSRDPRHHDAGRGWPQSVSAAAGRRNDAHHHAHGDGNRNRACSRTRDGRGRLSREAVQHAGAARPDSRGLAPVVHAHSGFSGRNRPRLRVCGLAS